MSKNTKVISLLEHHSFEIKDKKIILQNVSLSRDNHLEVVKCELLVREIPTQKELKALKKQIEEKLNREVALEALYRIKF